ncbi:MAG: hypothetical protein LUE64_02090 [Candidatus Gastranaerophilales bacterium]|nr:hypothetical protein [Candidatus Gastranaerophilales bacterium]
MYTNKCIKCGKEFETKNPKRVICPDCLYPDKAEAVISEAKPVQTGTEYPRSYSFGSDNAQPQQQRYNKRPYNNDNRRTYNNYNNRDNNYQRRDNNYQRQEGGGYQRQDGYRQDNRPRRPYNQNRPQGGYNNNGYNNRNNFNKRRPPQRPKQLLVNKEQLMQIEEMYKKMLPLPNPDAHEVIAAAINLEPKKVFFGINLVRQKLMLPKVQMPKRKLALTPDQLTAIKNLYEPLLPLPPIGCHKILAAQLKMDEWRVHVGIGLVRKQMGLDRWNQEREDAPEEYRKTS